MTVQKNANKYMQSWFFQDKWEAVTLFIPTHTKASGRQLHQTVLVWLCGNVRAVRSDLAVLERLGEINEMGQRVVKGSTH
jgi:hypothetical protein